MITRRRLLGSLAAGAVAGSWPLHAVSASLTTALHKPIPRTSELLPVIGMGSARTFDVGDDPDTLQGLGTVLRVFFEQGGALIDSSPMYGRAEHVLGALLAHTPQRDALFMATKVWTDGRAAGVAQMQRSRELLGVAPLDLMQIHNLRDWRTHWETLREWKAAGRVRYVGITTSHGRFHEALEEALRATDFDFVQLTYNLEDRAVEKRLLPLAAERGIAVLANRPFQKGVLFRRVRGRPLPDWATELGCRSWAQVFLKFVVAHPAVTCAIPATSKPRHMADNMGAGFGRLPDAELRARMTAWYDRL